MKRISKALKGWRAYFLASILIGLLAAPLVLAPWSDIDSGRVLSMPASWFFALIVFPVIAPLLAELRLDNRWPWKTAVNCDDIHHGGLIGQLAGA
ncbi:MAG: hypothetical protein H6888_04070 [Nitratireductor sp.]|nr:hypothetical protein [Nitratireductor sp.]